MTRASHPHDFFSWTADERAAHIASIVDDAPPLPKAVRDLWRRAIANAAAKPKQVAS